MMAAAQKGTSARPVGSWEKDYITCSDKRKGSKSSCFAHGFWKTRSFRMALLRAVRGGGFLVKTEVLLDGGNPFQRVVDFFAAAGNVVEFVHEVGEVAAYRFQLAFDARDLRG